MLELFLLWALQKTIDKIIETLINLIDHNAINNLTSQKYDLPGLLNDSLNFCADIASCPIFNILYVFR